MIKNNPSLDIHNSHRVITTGGVYDFNETSLIRNFSNSFVIGSFLYYSFQKRKFRG